jgi:hypothetical protein
MGSSTTRGTFGIEGRRPLRGLVGFDGAGPRVRGLTRGFSPSPPFGGLAFVRSRHSTGSRTHPWLYSSPPSWVRTIRCAVDHGFADSPVALFRHPLRGFGRFVARRTTGSRTHPWLYSVTPFGGSDDSLRGGPRVRGLTRGFIPSPPSGVLSRRPSIAGRARPDAALFQQRSWVPDR